MIHQEHVKLNMAHAQHGALDKTNNSHTIHKMCATTKLFLFSTTHIVSVELKFEQNLANDRFAQSTIKVSRLTCVRQRPPSHGDKNASYTWLFDILASSPKMTGTFSASHSSERRADRTEIRPAKSNRHCHLSAEIGCSQCHSA